MCRRATPGGSFGQRADVGVTPLTGHRIVVDTLKRVDMVLDLMGLLHSPEQLEILNAGTRMLLVVEPPDMLARMIPSTDDKRRVQAAQKRLKAAKIDDGDLEGRHRSDNADRPVSDARPMGLFG